MPKLRLIGQRNHLGGGTHFANFVDALKAISGIDTMVEEIDIFNQAQMERAERSATSADINIWFLRDPRISSFPGTPIIWAIFESDRPPDDYLDFLSQRSARVWVPSAWGRSVLIGLGLPAAHIDVVPEGVDPDQYHCHLRSSLDKSGEPFRFLMVGKFESRKGYRELLAGFHQAFGNAHDVELVIKGDFFIDSDYAERELSELIAAYGLRNVKLYWGDWSPAQMLGLYHYCDAFVFPSRAEGWGLPLLEAAASGLPLVTTFYSGQTEFLQHIDSSMIKIDFTLEPISHPDYARFWSRAGGNLGCWAVPHAASIAAGLTAVREQYPALLAAARQNSAVVREKFSWAVAAHRALDVLEQYQLLKADYTIVG